MTDRLDNEVARLEDSRSALLKAHVLGADRPMGTANPAVDEQGKQFAMAGALVPPYEPLTLALMLEHSNSLRQCVDSYVVNVHAHGHRFEPIVDLEADDANTKIAMLLMQAKLRAKPDPAVPNPLDQAELPTEEQVLAARKELEEQMRVEKARLDAFFQNCSLDYSFESLRMRTGADKEILGNGYWEVLRNTGGEIAQFNYIPGFSMRLMPIDQEPTRATVKVRVDEVTWGEIEVLKRFRRYVQQLDIAKPIYFKELGDPRCMSHATGRCYQDEATLREKEPHARPATEVMHFLISSSRTAYGIPRWIGVLLSVLGSRQVDEVNYTYFENKSVPPLVFLVSGGRMTEESVTRIQHHIDAEIKGKSNFHKILVLEADVAGAPGENTGRVKIDVKPLTMAQHNDALFQKYDERNMDKVGMSFRLPRMLRGDIRDFNRATADAALEFAEKQVFCPERDDFDWTMNRKILPELGIRFYTFKSNSPRLTDPQEAGNLLVAMTKEGILVPAEARQEASKILNRELRSIRAPWTRQPIALTLAGFAPPGEVAVGETGATGAVIQDEPQAEEPKKPMLDLSKMTPSSLATSVRVNEIREALGLGDLLDAGGAHDPDGDLMTDAFRAKQQAFGMGVGQAVGAEVGEEEAAGAVTEGKADMSTGDLAAGGGLLLPAQGYGRGQRRLRRVAMMEDALYLLNLRSAMRQAEEAEADRAFTAARAVSQLDADTADDVG